MQNAFFFIAILCCITSCKKQEFQKCIKEYSKHEYQAVLSCDNSSFQFEEVILNRKILSDEMNIVLNGPFSDGFTVTVSNDCSFTMTYPDSYIELLSNQDSLWIQGGTGEMLDINTISVQLETDYDSNCTLIIEKK